MWNAVLHSTCSQRRVFGMTVLLALRGPEPSTLPSTNRIHRAAMSDTPRQANFARNTREPSLPSEHTSKEQMDETTDRNTIGPRRRISRGAMLKTIAAGAAGVAATSMLGKGSALAAATPSDQQPSFLASGPAPASGTAFDATAQSSGAPLFTNGVNAAGTAFGVKGFGPRVGVYGAGNAVGVRGENFANATGVLGISFADATSTTHGSGTGVQGDSGSGPGVAGYSATATGVYGKSSGTGSSGVGVSGEGAIGVQGLGGSGVGVVGNVGSGTAIKGSASTGIAVSAETNSVNKPAVVAFNGGGGRAISASSPNGIGVTGSSAASPAPFGGGSGIVGTNTASRRRRGRLQPF